MGIDNKLLEIVLAALFHDIGKVRQRAGLSFSDIYKDMYCVNRNHYYAYQHAAHTAEFFDELGLNTQEHWKQIKELAAGHHRNDTIISKADQYSSGDRGFSSELLNEDLYSAEKEENFKIRKMTSIFSYLLRDEVKEDDFKYFEIQKITPDLRYVNSIKEYDSITAENRYKDIYYNILTNLKSILPKLFTINNEIKLFQYILKIREILENNLSFIPASTYQSLSDVSLFDHLLTTAALTTALYYNNKEFYWIKGNFTSIQRFIFHEYAKTQKYNAKLLRSRSFFVNAYTEYIALELCRQLNITPISILMLSAGNFAILAPKVDNIEEIINNIREKVNKEFEDLNFSQTKFIISYTKGDFKEVFDLSSYWKEVLKYVSSSQKEQINEPKEFGLNNFTKFIRRVSLDNEKEKYSFIPTRVVFSDYIDSLKGKNEVCDFCGIRPTSERESDGKYICDVCKKLKDIGEKLVKKTYLTYDFSEDEKLRFIDRINLVDKNEDKNLEDLTSSLKLVYSISNEDNEIPYKRIANYIPQIEQNEDELDELYKAAYNRLKEEGQIYEDIRKGNVKPFSIIAIDGLKLEEDKELKDKPYLAILKGDVDSLGRIFTDGFSNVVLNVLDKKIKLDINTISRVSTLSRLLEFYFTEVLKNKLIKKKFKNIYTVFSGGDDLFVIGHYREIFGIYREIIKDFKEYTENNNLHLSFGIKFFHYDEPIAIMADYAEEALERAKNSPGKDSLAIHDCDIVVKNDEADDLFKLEKEFKELINSDSNNKLKSKVSDSFVYRLYTYINMQEELRNNNLIDLTNNSYLLNNARWKPLLYYNLVRNIEFSKDLSEEEREKVILEIYNDLVNKIEKYGKKLVLPINLVVYGKRTYISKTNK